MANFPVLHSHLRWFVCQGCSVGHILSQHQYVFWRPLLVVVVVVQAGWCRRCRFYCSIFECVCGWCNLLPSLSRYCGTFCSCKHPFLTLDQVRLQYNCTIGKSANMTIAYPSFPALIIHRVNFFHLFYLHFMNTRGKIHVKVYVCLHITGPRLFTPWYYLIPSNTNRLSPSVSS